MTSKNQFVPRVDQVDANELNDEIVRTLQNRLIESVQHLSPSVLNRFQPEIELLLKTTLWIGSVGTQSASFGQQLFSIHYDVYKLTKSRLILHFLLCVILKYLKANAAIRLTNQRTLQTLLSHMETGYTILSTLNFFRFLKTGQSPNLIEYILGLNVVISEDDSHRAISYNYMNRELIWSGFIELFGVVLPSINYRKLRRKVQEILFGVEDDHKLRNVKPSLTLNTLCSYCYDRPTLPYHLGCGHVFCFYCINSNVAEDPGFICPDCDAKAITILPVNLKESSN